MGMLFINRHATNPRVLVLVAGLVLGLALVTMLVVVLVLALVQQS